MGQIDEKKIDEVILQLEKDVLGYDNRIKVIQQQQQAMEQERIQFIQKKIESQAQIQGFKKLLQKELEKKETKGVEKEKK